MSNPVTIHVYFADIDGTIIAVAGGVPALEASDAARPLEMIVDVDQAQPLSASTIPIIPDGHVGFRLLLTNPEDPEDPPFPENAYTFPDEEYGWEHDGDLMFIDLAVPEDDVSAALHVTPGTTPVYI